MAPAAKRAARRRPAARRPAAADPVERLRAICLALPDTTEKIAWGEPTWRVRGRLFAQLDDHHHGAGHLAVWLPAPLGVQELVVKSDPTQFFVPPYVGPSGWIGVVIRTVDREEMCELVTEAWRLTAPKRLLAAFDDPGDA